MILVESEAVQVCSSNHAAIVVVQIYLILARLLEPLVLGLLLECSSYQTGSIKHYSGTASFKMGCVQHY